MEKNEIQKYIQILTTNYFMKKVTLNSNAILGKVRSFQKKGAESDMKAGMNIHTYTFYITDKSNFKLKIKM